VVDKQIRRRSNKLELKNNKYEKYKDTYCMNVRCERTRILCKIRTKAGINFVHCAAL